jgi:predicted nucleic acid-binding protein
VKIDDALRGVTRLFLDTAPVIYFVEQNPAYAARVNDLFDRIDAGTVGAVTSPITLAECLVIPIRRGPPHLVRDFTDLITAGANVTFTPIDVAVAQEAARQRAAHNLTLTDALQVAVALAAGSGAFLTNDLTLKRITALPILILDELEL